MDALATAVAAMGAFYPGNYVEDAKARHQATIRLIAQLRPSSPPFIAPARAMR